jgi:hypothetical protein
MWGYGGAYSDWGDFLERWAFANQPLADRPPALDPEDFDGPTWTRLMTRIQDAVNTRLGRWSDSLVRQLNEATDEFSWGRALTHARVGLRTLLGLASMPELPKEVRDRLGAQLEGAITATQKTLEDAAHRDLRGPQARDAEMRLRQLRQNPLSGAFNPGLAESVPPNFPVSTPPASGGGRRRAIIIDREGDQ